MSQEKLNRDEAEALLAELIYDELEEKQKALVLEAIDTNPELSKLYEEMKATTEQLETEIQSSTPKLPDEKRTMLLELQSDHDTDIGPRASERRFQIETPKRKSSKDLKQIWTSIAALLMIGCGISLFIFTEIQKAAQNKSQQDSFALQAPSASGEKEIFLPFASRSLQEEEESGFNNRDSLKRPKKAVQFEAAEGGELEPETEVAADMTLDEVFLDEELEEENVTEHEIVSQKEVSISHYDQRSSTENARRLNRSQPALNAPQNLSSKLDGMEKREDNLTLIDKDTGAFLADDESAEEVVGYNFSEPDHSKAYDAIGLLALKNEVKLSKSQTQRNTGDEYIIDNLNSPADRQKAKEKKGSLISSTTGKVKSKLKKKATTTRSLALAPQEQSYRSDAPAPKRAESSKSTMDNNGVPTSGPISNKGVEIGAIVKPKPIEKPSSTLAYGKGSTLTQPSKGASRDQKVGQESLTPQPSLLLSQDQQKVDPTYQTPEQKAQVQENQSNLQDIAITGTWYENQENKKRTIQTGSLLQPSTSSETTERLQNSLQDEDDMEEIVALRQAPKQLSKKNSSLEKDSNKKAIPYSDYVIYPADWERISDRKKRQLNSEGKSETADTSTPASSPTSGFYNGYTYNKNESQPKNIKGKTSAEGFKNGDLSPIVTVDGKGSSTHSSQVGISMDNSGLSLSGNTAGDILMYNGTNWVRVDSDNASEYALVSDGSNISSRTLTGDVTISSAGIRSLEISGVSTASYGSGNLIPTFTVDAKGRITTTEQPVISISGHQFGVSGNTAGDLLMYDGTNWVRVGSGNASGNILVGAGTHLVAKTLTQQEQQLNSIALASPPPPAELDSPQRSRQEERKQNTSSQPILQKKAKPSPKPVLKEEKAIPFKESIPPRINPFVLTEKDPLSTFSLDSDTASFRRTLRTLRSGQWPQPSDIRVEEFVNAMHYHYPNQQKQVFDIHTHAMPSPFGQDLVLMRIGVQSRAPGPEGRRPTHLVFVIDTSSSMAQKDRLPWVQLALKSLLEKLDQRDRISLIIYGQKAQLIFEAKKGDQQMELKSYLSSLDTDGSTNLEEGLRLGYQIAERHFQPHIENRLILCSDGVANVGEQQLEELLKRVKHFKRQGISLSTVGFGQGHYRDTLMEQLSNQGNGKYLYIDSEKRANEVFQEEFASLVHTAASDARVQVQFNPNRVRRYRLLGYENRKIKDADFRQDHKVVAAQVSYGGQSTALYELELHPKAQNQEPSLGQIFLRYRNTQKHQIEEIRRELHPGMISRPGALEQPRLWLSAIAAECAEILRKSDYVENKDWTQLELIINMIANELPLDQRAQELKEIISLAKKLSSEK